MGPSILSNIHLLPIMNRPLNKITTKVPGSMDIFSSSIMGEGVPTIIRIFLLKKNSIS